MLDQKWFRQDTHQMYEEWYFFLSDSARLAWMYMKAYIREGAASQKQAGMAPVLSSAVISHRWRIAEEAISEMISAAITGGHMSIANGHWVLTDRSSVVSPKTAERDQKQTKAEKQASSSDLSAFVGQTETNSDTSEQTGTLSDTLSRDNTIQDNTNKKELSNESSKKEPNGDDLLFVDPPWWAEKYDSKPDMLASILAKWASEVVWKTGNRAFLDEAIRRDLMLKVAEWLLEFVPDMDSLNAELAKIKNHAARQPRSKQDWVSPDLVLRSCLVKLESTWRSVKRSRKWDAEREGRSSHPAKGKSAMELLAEKRAQEQAKSAANELGIDPNTILEAV